ncbi:TPA: Arm DNA-binding domain-containing protein [Salmonella enterica subsp. enterica serovar Virchow]|uniref:Arm DNA-binding domain-containing protein n=1 Tax=Salmonella TaxID=590 RepID=UPI0002FCA08C|nr:MULTISPECIES: Arm DNA-binding domain-containing protein [Salmonella]MDK9109231.1 Arm DNA-binding domain-containing protein [Salmonella enterica subsp. enterica serovar Aberdeen]MCN0255794.1 Arm DNA-binding domain-containing protein [Salmonella enterica]MDJ3705958.1 Arm DNA-binding domain-containing protein [Salmonella enterica]MDJ3965551.1 Arm DNA-binding domain-containing protein [Salmonella enterica]MDJ4572039.1 Arm DNA-binding domain-containing protein [Salmonella enterica]
MTLAQARRMREEAQLLLISGIDPSAHRKAERLAITPEHTFEPVGGTRMGNQQRELVGRT